MIGILDAATLLAFFTTSTVLNLTPGPAVLRTIGDSMQHGAMRAHGTILGILAANGMYCALAVLGLGAVIQALPQLFDIIKWVGVSYLMWIALNALKAAWTGVPEGQIPPSVSASKLFVRSFLLQGANPKSPLFFCAMLPVFAGEAEGAPGRIAVLGAIAIAAEYPVLLGYALLGSRALKFAKTPLARRVMDAFSGIALIAAAAMVARTTLEKR